MSCSGIEYQGNSGVEGSQSIAITVENGSHSETTLGNVDNIFLFLTKEPLKKLILVLWACLIPRLT